MVLTTLVAMAQTKKVAILDVIDKDNTVPYATRLMLRSVLGESVANMPGYESYERSDIDAIMSEQDFQRTGMVSDEQIRRLGEMSGVTYILLTEAVKLDDKNLFISAKVLNVETAKTISSATETSSMQPASLRNACNSIVNKLLGMKDVEKGIAQQGWKMEGYDTYYLIKVDRNEYKYGNTILDKKAYEQFLKNNCPEAWRKYRKGQKEVIAGWSVFGAGLAMTTIGGAIMGAFKDNKNQSYDFGVLALAISPAVIAAGIITFSCGYSAKSNAYKTYNTNCANKQVPMSLSIQSSQNGLGLALNF